MVVDWLSETLGEDLRVTWWVMVWGDHALSATLEPQTASASSPFSVLLHLLQLSSAHTGFLGPLIESCGFPEVPLHMLFLPGRFFPPFP